MANRRNKQQATAKPGWGEELDRLLSLPTAFRAFHVSEPSVLAGDNHPAPDPKVALSLYGPWTSKDDPGRQQVRVGIIGTGETITMAQAWIDACRGRVDPHLDDDADPFLFPTFPGFEADDGFRCRLDAPQSLVETLTAVDIAKCTKAAGRDHAVEAMAATVGERLQVLADRESPPDVVIVALPNEVREAAGAGRRRPRRVRPEPERKQLTLAFLDPKPLEPFTPSRTLHRAIKAEGMRAGLCTQLMWPGSLEGGSDVQDDATRAWNFCTALYYKAGGIPWKASGLGKNTCYVGISFFQPIDAIGQLQASMAQAFSDRGEGMVLRGSRFTWDRTQGPPHLSRDGAKEILRDVLAQYERHHKQKPARVVVYKSSSFSDVEVEGMTEALAGVSDYFDFLSVAPSNIRFLRTGQEPPIRGTAIQVAERRYVMYTRGYVPFLKLYPGMRIPQPMLMQHAVGTGSVKELMGELLALTRMNWNSADFASAEPITLGFARNIGLILSELPKNVEARTSFRFYM